MPRKHAINAIKSFLYISQNVKIITSIERKKTHALCEEEQVFHLPCSYELCSPQFLDHHSLML